MSTQDEDFMLEDEEDNSGHLQPPYSSLSSAMVTSPTTDTLDSVVLESSPFDDFGKDGDTGLDESVDLGPSELAGGIEINIGKRAGFDLETTTDTEQSREDKANISSYFADSGDDFFDSLGAAKDDNQLGNDLFTSIAISKSEEDIFASEMNAIEIKESDVIGVGASQDGLNNEGMRRINSFIRKSNEEEKRETLDNVDQFVEIAAAATESLSKDLKDQGFVNESSEFTEIEPENVTRIHLREHAASICEPETIAFEGEGERGASDQADLQIADIEEEEIEEFSQNDERPGFLSQLSQSQQLHHQVPGVLSPPVDSSARLHGPVVGTTPSQLSPVGTPIHLGDGDCQDVPALSPSIPPIIPPAFETQSSISGSPFCQPSQEMKSGSVFAPFGSTGPADDAFTSILSMSDADRRHDAWIPSDATSHILKTIATSPAGTYITPIEQLSTPGVLTFEPQSDPVRELVLRYMGEQEAIKRSVLTADSVTQDIDGLKKLIEAGCLHAAIDLTGVLLEQVGQGYGKCGQVIVHTLHSLQLWFCRLALMVKLRMYEQAEAEMRAFQTLDTPDLYFQFYANTYPGRRGSMVSFSMRLLHAELPLLCGRSQETLDRLYYMLAVCNRIKLNLSSDLSEDGSATHMTYEARKVSLELWSKRETDIMYKIGSTMLSVKDYEGALIIYNSLLEKEQNTRLELLAGIGRIHLQMGNITEATRIMKEVEEATKTDGSLSCYNLISRGLVAMCGSNFFDAYQHFKSAVQMKPHNTCAVNNMAVCSLYLGRLKDALNTLEQLVHSDPANTLHEGVLFNLCTLYELETSRALHKKQAILDLVSKHKGDGFPVGCLKMT
ncbi:unnamed protein product [Candidula unifasciata]|uniref:Trafficking protein particle complex subunit 12 n=1 Tax=Candidula unifasciata TaxID=100452 RepID=A0A8S3ZB03_9EUPU|nr:unnamed protein product [Candidula unifasciata]